MIDKSRVLSLLDFDEIEGVFRWKQWMGGTAKKGSISGAIDSKGYRQIRIDGRLYLAHRIVWLITHGEWPDHHIDHIDRNPLNITPSNLRKCTHAQNHQNVGVRSDNSSGVTGVSFLKKSGRWLAYININRKRIRIGEFEDFEDAVKARLEAKKEVHLYSPNQIHKGKNSNRWGEQNRKVA